MKQHRAALPFDGEGQKRRVPGHVLDAAQVLGWNDAAVVAAELAPGVG
jgi:hypothetical protein